MPYSSKQNFIIDIVFMILGTLFLCFCVRKRIYPIIESLHYFNHFEFM